MPTVWVWKVTCVVSGVVPPFITASDIDNAMLKVHTHLTAHSMGISSIQAVERVAHFQVSDARIQEELFTSRPEN